MSGKRVYLAVDLGADSGRVMAGIHDGHKLVLEEMARFPTGGMQFPFPSGCSTKRVLFHSRHMSTKARAAPGEQKRELLA